MGFVKAPVTPLASNSPTISPEVAAQTVADAPTAAVDPSTYVSPPQTAPVQAPVPVQTQVPTQVQAPVLPATTAASGWDDLEVGFGSFPRVKLDAGKFWVNSEMIGDSFQAVMMDPKKVWIYRASEDDNAEAVWTTDGVWTTNKRLLSDVVAEWASQGYTKPEIKETLEVIALMIDTKYEGEFVMLSIPSTSVKRLAGYRTVQYHKYRVYPDQLVTRVFADNPIKSGGYTWIPWGFQCVRALQEAA